MSFGWGMYFGDSIRHWKEAEEAVMEADICLIMGTTLQVKPFNLLPENANIVKYY